MPETEETRLKRKRKRKTMAAAIIIVVIGIIFLGLWWLEKRPFDTESATGEVIQVPCSAISTSCIKVRYPISAKYEKRGQAEGRTSLEVEYGVRNVSKFKEGDKVTVIYYKSDPTTGYVKE